MHDRRTTTETHLRPETKETASSTHESLLPVWRCKGTLFKLDSAGAMTLSCSRRVTVLEVAATFFNEWSFFVIMAFELWLLRRRPGEEAVGRLMSCTYALYGIRADGPDLWRRPASI